MLWGYVITGVVGIAGTALGSLLTGRAQTNNLRLSISAENERARIAEKRRVYAACQAAIDAMTAAGMECRRYSRLDDTDEAKAARAQRSEASSALSARISEVRLIGPRDLSLLALGINARVLNFVGLGELETLGEVARMQRKLIDAMRADLGESD